MRLFISILLAAALLVAPVHAQQSKDVRKVTSTGNLLEGFNTDKTHNFLSGANVTFAANSTLSIVGTVNINPTTGTWNLSNVTVIGLPGGGDAATSGTLDQFANVTQAAGKSLAIAGNTTLGEGSHSGTNTGDQNIILSGAIAGSGTGNITTTMANTTVSPTTYGNATHVGRFTVGPDGRLTFAESVAITGGAGNVINGSNFANGQLVYISNNTTGEVSGIPGATFNLSNNTISLGNISANTVSIGNISGATSDYMFLIGNNTTGRFDKGTIEVGGNMTRTKSGNNIVLDSTAGGGSGATISDTAPGSPSGGTLWWDSVNGVMKIYYPDGSSSQWVDATPIPPPPVPVGPWQRVTWVDKSLGSDTTGQVGRPDKPFADVRAAHDACVTAGGNHLIHVRRGTYTSTGLTPGTAGNSIYYYYDQGATHQITGASHLFDWTGNNPTIEYVILGYGRFEKTSDVAGAMINSSYATSACLRFTVEAELILNVGTGYTAGPLCKIELGISGGTDDAMSIFRVNRADVHGGSQPIYFRVGGTLNQVSVACKSMIRGVHFDQGIFYCYGPAYDAVQVGLNNFAVPQVMFMDVEKIKGTDQPAVLIRTGWVRVQGGNVEVTNAGEDCVKVRNDASASSGIKLHFVGTTFVQRGGTSSFRAIDFESVGAGIQTRLQNCAILMENGATPAITASGAITVDVQNGLTSNATAGDGNVTFRGATPVVEAGFFTGFHF